MAPQPPINFQPHRGGFEGTPKRSRVPQARLQEDDTSTRLRKLHAAFSEPHRLQALGVGKARRFGRKGGKERQGNSGRDSGGTNQRLNHLQEPGAKCALLPNYVSPLSKVSVARAAGMAGCLRRQVAAGRFAGQAGMARRCTWDRS